MRIWDHYTLFKSAYTKCVEPVCQQYGLTRMELDILLFLANNPEYDTASDIIEKKRLTKSHVSSSVKSLEDRGWIEKVYYENNRKTAHLRILEDAFPAIIKGQHGQKLFIDTLFAGFSDTDRKEIKKLLCAVIQNLEIFLSEESL